MTHKDELAGGASRAATDGNGTPSPTSATSRALTYAPAPAPGPTGMYIDVNLQRATKLVLELFVKGQEYG